MRTRGRQPIDLLSMSTMHRQGMLERCQGADPEHSVLRRRSRVQPPTPAAQQQSTLFLGMLASVITGVATQSTCINLCGRRDSLCPPYGNAPSRPLRNVTASPTDMTIVLRYPHRSCIYAVRRITCTPESLSTRGLSSPGWRAYVASWGQLCHSPNPASGIQERPLPLSGISSSRQFRYLPRSSSASCRGQRRRGRRQPWRSSSRSRCWRSWRTRRRAGRQ